jgi:hypothetical protein
MYGRDLLLHHQVQHANVYLLAKVWHLAQILPPTKDVILKINTTLSRYMWKGSIFKVPLSTLHLSKKHEGWGLTHLEAKCRMLLICRMAVTLQQHGTPTELLLTTLGLRDRSRNPPPMDRRLAHFE